MTEQRVCANRRELILGAAALPLLAAPLAMAAPMPATDPWAMPENMDPNIFANGLIGAASVAHSILSNHRPAGAMIKGFQFHCLDGEIDHVTIWATVVTPDYRLLHARPAVYNGWR
jgi:hypothetical protein